MPKELYQQLYPKELSPGKFYRTAKIHKLQPNRGIDELPLRPIISKIDTATHKTAHYLGKVLLPLSQSDYTVSSSKELTEIINLKSIPDNHKLFLFDVKSLLTNVPLESTIEILYN